MNSRKTSLLILSFLVISLIFMSLKKPENTEILQIEPLGIDTSLWIAPASANKLINPVEMNDEAVANGLLVYKKNCRSCHGRNGDGQGVEADDLTIPATDFTNPSFVKQTDGSMFWKISEGRNDMEPFKKQLDEEEIWQAVIYIKTFSQVSEE